MLYWFESSTFRLSHASFCRNLVPFRAVLTHTESYIKLERHISWTPALPALYQFIPPPCPAVPSMTARSACPQTHYEPTWSARSRASTTRMRWRGWRLRRSANGWRRRRWRLRSPSAPAARSPGPASCPPAASSASAVSAHAQDPALIDGHAQHGALFSAHARESGILFVPTTQDWREVFSCWGIEIGGGGKFARINSTFATVSSRAWRDADVTPWCSAERNVSVLTYVSIRGALNRAHNVFRSFFVLVPDLAS